MELFAINPPSGGDSANSLLSAELLGGGTSAAGGAFGSGAGASLPGELSVNPALAAGEQRIVLDASYAALIGTGDDSGLGHTLNLGVVFPTRAAVYAGSLNFLTSPFDTLPLGTAGTVRGSVSKDLTDTIYVGAGLAASVGSGWGVAGDLGILFKLGDVGFMKDARFGGSITGLGRTFTPDTEGVKGGAATGWTSMITPRMGYAATLASAKFVKLGATADLSFPTAQNFAFDAGIEALFKDILSIRTSWNFNLLETINNSQTYLPSIGVGVNLKLNSKKENSFFAKNGWAQSDITPTVAVKPIYKDIYAVGTGVNVRLGVTDIDPPAIVVTYPEPVYISPNNDGTQDALEFPVSISDKRFVLAWAFVIENDKGETVRTIANKEVRTEMQDIKSFWKLLTKVKQGIDLPESLRWDGILDSGETASDGTYKFYITAEDDNGNKVTSEKYVVFVDGTAPVVTATAPAGSNAMIFSPDGDGNKDSYPVKQTGSIEDKWTAIVTNSAGSAVRTIETKSAAPADFAWDGKNDANSIVPDGVYAYKISATDRGGNSAEARIDNIILDTEKPAVNVSIDMNAFSPNDDKVKDMVILTPSVPVITGLIDWEVTVTGKTGTAIRTYSGTSAPKPIPFDGKTAAGTTAPEGDYQAVISARYVNGYAPVARSPYFTLDVTAPESTTRASIAIFSPVGDGKLDTVTFTQTATTEPSWIAEIFPLGTDNNMSGKPVRQISLGASPEATFVWDGRDDTGKLAADGNYAYRLSATDRAGNTGTSNLAVVELNTEKADLILQQSLAFFSPNGDKVKDTITFTPVIKASTAVAKYALTIKNSAGAVVKTFAGTGKVPASFSWNGIAEAAEGSVTGERCPDGSYNAALVVTLVNQQESRSQAPDFAIDTVFPTIEISTPYVVISPNGDASRDDLPVTQRSSAEDLWNATILNDRKAVVKAYTWNGQAGSFTWDATDDSGNRVADGTYSYSVSSEDKAGNRTSQQLTGIKVDARTPKAYLTAELASFSPNGDGVKDTQKLAIVTSVTDGLSSWSVSIKADGQTAAVKTWNAGAEAQALPAFINWDGKDASQNAVAGGKYVATLELSYEKGDRVTVMTPAFLVNPKAPALGVRLAPKYFSPDNDGIEDELFINLTAESLSSFTEWSFEIREPAGSNGNVFWKTGGSGKITERIIWDGRSLKGELVQAATDYPFTFTVKDDVGMTSVVKGYIPVDVLVIREGDKLKIAVPSIIFRENAADFNGLDGAVVDKNTAVLRRIAEILNKFKDYRIQVEGHANNVTGTQKEEDSELIPLSQQRAEAVKAFLVANGVSQERLSTVGMGGTRPVATRADRENWWKNRRVEFVLIK
jgi:flagellar hook assembly protein FlgD